MKQDTVSEDTVTWDIGVHVCVGSKFGRMLAEVGKWPAVCCALMIVCAVSSCDGGTLSLILLVWYWGSEARPAGTITTTLSQSIMMIGRLCNIRASSYSSFPTASPVQGAERQQHRWQECPRSHFSILDTLVHLFNQIWSWTQRANCNLTPRLPMRLQISGWLWMLLINVFTSLLVIRKERVLLILHVSKLSPLSV